MPKNPVFRSILPFFHPPTQNFIDLFKHQFILLSSIHSPIHPSTHPSSNPSMINLYLPSTGPTNNTTIFHPSKLHPFIQTLIHPLNLNLPISLTFIHSSIHQSSIHHSSIHYSSIHHSSIQHSSINH